MGRYRCRKECPQSNEGCFIHFSRNTRCPFPLGLDSVRGDWRKERGRTRSLDPFERLCNHGGESSDRTVKIKEVSLVTVFPFPSVVERPNRKQLGQSESWIFFWWFCVVVVYFVRFPSEQQQRHLQQAARYLHSSFFRPFDRRESGPPPLASR